MPSRHRPPIRSRLLKPGARAAVKGLILCAVLLAFATGTVDSQKGPERIHLSGAAASTTWNALPSGGFDGGVLAIARSGSDLYMAGYFGQTADGSLWNLGNIVRYDMASMTWHALPNMGLSAVVYALAVSGDDLYVGGEFTQTGDGSVTNMNSIARYDTSNDTWHPLPNRGLSHRTGSVSVQALALLGSTLYVGGVFSQTGDGTTTDLGCIARYDVVSRSWHALPNEGLNKVVRSLAVHSGNLYVGGDFDRTGDGSLEELGYVARFDGAWHALANKGLRSEGSGGVRALVAQVVRDGSGNLFVGGRFSRSGDGARGDLNNIARYDLSSNTWHPLSGAGLNGMVHALEIDVATLYVGGSLTQTQDASLADLGRIARYDLPTSRWQALPNQGLGVGGAGVCKVDTIAVVDSDVYVGGGFSNSGDWTVLDLNGIARFGPPPHLPHKAYLPAALRQ